MKADNGGAGQLKEEIKCEILGISLVALAILGLVSLLSPSNGLISEFFYRVLKSLAGEGRYLLPVLLALIGGRLVYKRERAKFTPRMIGVLIVFFVILTFLHQIIPLSDSFKAGAAGDGGGLIGGLFSYLFRRSFGTPGAYVILTTATLVALLLLTNLSFSAMAGGLYQKLIAGLKRVGSILTGFLFTEVEEEEQKEDKKKRKPVIINHAGGQVVVLGGSPSSFAAAEKDEPPAVPPPEEAGRERDAAGDVAGKVLAAGGDEKDGPADEEKTAGTEYQLPPVTILARPLRMKNLRVGKDISENIKILEETLESFGIKARVTQVSRGPAITRYEIQPPQGIKVSRIVSLADDIALSMAAPDVRIEAPIPGKAAVGIEVPNREVSMVHLRELIEAQEFTQSPSRLTVALGKDIAGNPVVSDMAKMPHLLIAGATGSGKSVCVNTLIASILFKATPDKVKFLMIDPKMVELATYNGIPHLVSPVVTDPKKAASSLRWAVREMERRYELFAATGVRDITRYNHLFKSRDVAAGERPLPLIVVIIDELADLMMVAPADVEDAVCRLAQMARAAGIHLLVATQRPSVDVITGLIKANIPSRISFAVSSQVDSRTILDMGGAEKLLGKGDMLFFPVGASKPVRVQGAFLSDREVEDLVTFWKKQAEPAYDEKVTRDEPKAEEADEEEDELLPQAVHILIESGHASISMLQRRLHIGYARAARLIDLMERRGIVGGYEGSKPRSILMTLEQFNQVFKKK
jgi:S-DNA-T family DNA segregation ATPase FtsK/SpoIIIE